MSVEENKATVRRFYEEIDKGNIGILDELMAEDYIDHSPPPFPTKGKGREAVKEFFFDFSASNSGLSLYRGPNR